MICWIHAELGGDICMRVGSSPIIFSLITSTGQGVWVRDFLSRGGPSPPPTYPSGASDDSKAIQSVVYMFEPIVSSANVHERA